MQSTLSMKDADPHDIFAVEPNFAPRTDSAAPTLAPADTGSSEHREPHFGPSIAGSSSVPPVTTVPSVTPVPSVAPVPPAAPMYRATATDDIRLDDTLLNRASPAPNKWAVRAFWFVFAIVSAMGAAAWQHYGDRAKQIVSEWTPQVALLSSLIPGKAAPAPDSVAQAATADQPAAGTAPAAPSPDVATAAPTAAPAQAATPTAAPAAPPPGAPDQTQLLQSMARDLASMGQQIEQLKASIAQLKAGQDQLAQRVARTTETRAVAPRPATPRPAATTTPHAAVVPPPVRRPPQAYIPPPPPLTAGRASVAPLPAAPAPLPQAAAPVQLQSPPQSAAVDAEDDGPVVRPPMPMR